MCATATRGERDRALLQRSVPGVGNVIPGTLGPVRRADLGGVPGRAPGPVSGVRLTWFRGKSYDRTHCLAEAARARARGKPAKAIARYREVLAHEPGNADVHRRLAPLLATTGQPEEAWGSYRVASGCLLRAGFVERAVGVLREAAGHLPRERSVWEELAAAEQQRERPIDAVLALLEGRRHFRGRRHCGEAIRLLLAVRRLAPEHFEANFDLAGLLARNGAPGPAASILGELAGRAEGRELRRVRWRQLRRAPSPAALWRWLRSWAGLR